MLKRIEEVKDELVEILFQYQMLNDNTYDFKIRILMEQISVLEDILNDELEEFLIDWQSTWDIDKEEHCKYK